jgi:hypothetical protein
MVEEPVSGKVHDESTDKPERTPTIGFTHAILFGVSFVFVLYIYLKSFCLFCRPGLETWWVLDFMA